MKFHKVLTSIGTINKQEVYYFDVTEEQKAEAMKRTFENPLMIYKESSVIALYSHNGELRLNYFISYYGFKEGLGKHEAKEYDNIVLCSCGKRFPQGKKKNGMKNFNKHLENIKKLQEEND